MGLNDNFFTLPTQSEDEAENKVITAKAFAPAALGDTPELLDSVEFIAIPQEEVAQDEAALETICVGLRNIQLFGAQLRDQGGISMGMALESLDFLPSLVTENHPKEFYTSHVSRTSLSYALEQEETQTKSLLQRAVETMRAFFGRIVGWFKQKLAALTGKDKIQEAAKREEELKKKLADSEARANKLAEEYDQLRRASAGDVASYKEQLGIATAQVKEAVDLANDNATRANNAVSDGNRRVAEAEARGDERAAAAQAEAAAQVGAANAKVGELTVKLRDLQTQMRNLDETKSQEIAVALDKLEALQRKAATSRAARLEVTAQAEELRAIVSKNITKSIAEVMEKKNNELLESYSQFCRNRIGGAKLVLRYMLGSGIAKRVQMIEKTSAFLEKSTVLADHMAALHKALAVISTDPSKMNEAMTTFDGSGLGQLDVVFENNNPSVEELKAVPAQRLTVFLREMQASAEKGRLAAEKADFSKLVSEVEAIQKQLESEQSLKVEYKFVNPVAEAYRALQKHIGKILPLISHAARISHELTNLGSALITCLPSRLAYVGSPDFDAFAQKALVEVCSQVGVSQNYLTSADQEVKGHAITALTRAGQA